MSLNSSSNLLTILWVGNSGRMSLSGSNLTNLVFAGASGDGRSAFKTASSLTCGESRWSLFLSFSPHGFHLLVSLWNLGFLLHGGLRVSASLAGFFTHVFQRHGEEAVSFLIVAEAQKLAWWNPPLDSRETVGDHISWWNGITEFEVFFMYRDINLFQNAFAWDFSRGL